MLIQSWKKQDLGAIESARDQNDLVCRGSLLQFFVLTVGRDEALIREYICHRERKDQRLKQLNF